MPQIKQAFKQTPVLPTITINDVNHAIPLARALINARLPVFSIHLNTVDALESIRTLSTQMPYAVVGASHVIDRMQVNAAKAAGAQFVILPSITPSLITEAKAQNLLTIPSVATSSEIMTARTMGFETMQFFPAACLGGIAALKHYGQLFPEVKFIAAGGITRANMRDYLALANVLSITAEWIAPQKMVQEELWSDISAYARESLVSA